MTLFSFTLVVDTITEESKTLFRYIYFVARISQAFLREKHTFLTSPLSVTMILEVAG